MKGPSETLGQSDGATEQIRGRRSKCLSVRLRINKVLFTRLCRGVYLYGHLAVVMRLGQSGELQVSFEGKDYTAKEFIHNFEVGV